MNREKKSYTMEDRQMWQSNWISGYKASLVWGGTISEIGIRKKY